jgi:hypothetical protein
MRDKCILRGGQMSVVKYILAMILSCSILTLQGAVTFVNRSNQALNLEFFGAYHQNTCSVSSGSKCTVKLVKSGPRVMQLSMTAKPPKSSQKEMKKGSKGPRRPPQLEKSSKISASFSTISPGTYNIIMQSNQLKVERA